MKEITMENEPTQYLSGICPLMGTYWTRLAEDAQHFSRLGYSL